MPLMCCDYCSEIDFKPLGLEVSHICFCEACKQISTHTLVLQDVLAGAKKINPSELIIKDKAMLIFESNNEFAFKHALMLMDQCQYETAHLR